MLSRGGADAVVLREFDLPTREFVPEGFTLPEAKGGAAWVDRDTLLLSSALGEGMATHSGYARTVRLWRRGTDALAALVIFATRLEPAERLALQGFFWSGGRLVVSILDDLKPVFEVLTPSNAGWSRECITGLPEIGVAHVWSLDLRTEESTGDLLASAQDPQ